MVTRKINEREEIMTVQEFYDWCKERKFTDAELVINLKSIGCDGENVVVTEHNINYFESKKPEKRKFVTLGG